MREGNRGLGGGAGCGVWGGGGGGSCATFVARQQPELWVMGFGRGGVCVCE